jgi:23S rRNA (adenine2503-C2)-methyltransferase
MTPKPSNKDRRRRPAPKPPSAKPSAQKSRVPRASGSSTGRPQGQRRRADRGTPDVPVVVRRPAPAQDRSPQTLLSLYRPDIAALLQEKGSETYRYGQVYEHLFHKLTTPFAEASTLPVELRSALAPLGLSTLRQVQEQTAADGTTKLLLATQDDAYIECVIMRYSDRITLCLSSQIGCPVGCHFCATGSMGFRRNLSAAEIVDQVRVATDLAGPEGRRVSNIVYMGMGEPLLNLQAVLDSIRIVTDPRGFGLAHRALSVSTVGIPSGIRRLGRVEPQVNLALSLHAADDETRALLVPKRYRHPVSEILDAAWEHFALTHRKLLVEYVLIGGVNDSPDHARALARLLRGHVVAVNLLAWNAVRRAAMPRGSVPHARPSGRGPGVTESATAAVPLHPPNAASVAAFREILLTNHIEAVVRRSKGGSIQGACGQLAGKRSS